MPGSGAEDFEFVYALAPEKRSEKARKMPMASGFTVSFRGGEVLGWGLSYSMLEQVEKGVGGGHREESTLKVIAPETGPESGGGNGVDFGERMVIPDPEQPVNHRDLHELVMMGMQLASGGDWEAARKTTVEAKGDFMKMLARHCPEVAALRTAAKDGRVKVGELDGVLEPYAMGGKELPPGKGPGR